MTMSQGQMVELGYERALTSEFIIEQDKNAKNIFDVYNPETNGDYIVMARLGRVLSCSCPHHFYRKVTCKHQIAVALRYGLNW